MSGAGKILGANIVNKQGAKVDIAKECAGKVVGLYFSAHWCPPCRGFTPALAEFYTKHAGAKKLEIVFVSSDRDQKSFDDYFGSMPWLALGYDDREAKEALSGKYGVRGIPTFVLIDGDSGEVICQNARGNVSSDPEAATFPWKE